MRTQHLSPARAATPAHQVRAIAWIVGACIGTPAPPADQPPSRDNTLPATSPLRRSGVGLGEGNPGARWCMPGRLLRAPPRLCASTRNVRQPPSALPATRTGGQDTPEMWHILAPPRLLTALPGAQTWRNLAPPRLPSRISWRKLVYARQTASPHPSQPARAPRPAHPHRPASPRHLCPPRVLRPFMAESAPRPPV
jgi:hypothetical protein